MDHCWNSVVYPRNRHNQNYPNHFSHGSCLYSQLITKGCDFILVLIMVIGGKLTILPGAVVEGLEGSGSGDGGYTLPAATANTLGGIKVGSGLSVTQDGVLSADGIMPAAHQADSEATTIAALKEDFNTLLAALRTAGLMASAPADEGGDG